jgi:hypothetical protein
MKNIILIILFWGVSQIQAQTKKEQIQILSLKIDSLIHIVNSERDLNAIEKNKYEDKFKNYFKEIESLNKSIKDLNVYIDKYKFKLDSVNSAFNLEIKTLRDSLKNISTLHPIGFLLPYSYGKIKKPLEEKELSTVFLPFKKSYYIIADSIISNINNHDQICFYFITPLEKEINLQCPNQYGLIIVNKYGVELYKSFWDSESMADLAGNCSPNVMQFKINNRFRNLLSLGKSGCGSGTSIQYYDIQYSSAKIEFKEAFSCGSGYSDIYFMPEKNMYLKIERINPACHYSCPSKYKISSFLLSNDQLLKSDLTKFNYDDYNDTGIETLIKNIKTKEPNVFIE